MIISSLFTLAGCFGGKEFTVTFNPDGGVRVGGGELVQTVKSAADIYLPIVEKEGYTFMVWDKVISEIDSDTTVKAVWKPNMFKVTFVVSGGTHISGDLVQTVLRGRDLVAPVYERDGYVLIWDKNLSEINEACTVNGIWVASQYNLSFVNSDGSVFAGTESLIVNYGEEVPKLPEGTKGDQRIFAWKKQGTIQDYVYDGQKWEYTEDLVLEPVYRTGYRIKYDFNGGTFRLNPIRVPTSGNTIINSPTKDGYVFVGWVETDANGNILEGAKPNENLVISSSTKRDIYLKAIWQEEVYSIDLTTIYGHFANGKQIISMQVVFGEKVGELPKIFGTEAIFSYFKYGEKIITPDTVWDIKEGSVILEAVFQKTYIFNLVLECKLMYSGVIQCSVPEGTPLVYKLTEGDQLILPTATVILPEGVNDPYAYAFVGWIYYKDDGTRVEVKSGTVVTESNFSGVAEEQGIVRIDLISRVKNTSSN